MIGPNPLMWKSCLSVAVMFCWKHKLQKVLFIRKANFCVSFQTPQIMALWDCGRFGVGSEAQKSIFLTIRSFKDRSQTYTSAFFLSIFSILSICSNNRVLEDWIKINYSAYILCNKGTCGTLPSFYMYNISLVWLKSFWLKITTWLFTWMRKKQSGKDVCFHATGI